MERTTIMLPTNLKQLAKRQARALGISFGEWVRESMATRLKNTKKGKGWSDDPFFSDRAVFHGTPPDLSQNHDDYLYGKVE